MSTFDGIDLIELGQRVYRRRVELGYDQREIGDRSGLSREYVSRLETGNISNPKIRDLNSIARALDRSLNWLLYGGPPPLTDDEEQELQTLLADPEMRVEFATTYRDMRVKNWSDADKRFVLDTLRAARDLVNARRQAE